LNTIFWLVFLFLLARSIWRLMERAGGKGRFDGPLGGPPPGMGRPVPESEEKPKLKIPEYLTRRSEEPPGYEQPDELSVMRRDWEEEPLAEYSEPVVLAEEMAAPPVKGQPSGLCPEGPVAGAEVKAPCGMEGEKGGPARKRCERSDQEGPFSDMVCPGQVVKGMVWSQILGPRGGLRPKKRWNCL